MQLASQRGPGGPRAWVVAATLVMAAGAAHALYPGQEAWAQGKAAQEYEILAYEANELKTPADLAAILWSYTVACEGIDNDFARRQCAGLRKARQEQLARRTFRMSGDRLAFSARDYDEARKGVEFKLYSCLACGKAVLVEGSEFHVLGTGERTVFGTAVLGPVMRNAWVKAADAGAAAAWKSDAVPRLRTEFVFRIPEKEQMWKQGQVQGFVVEILGFRVYDPCTGEIIAAQPRAVPLTRDPRTCTGQDLLALRRAEDEARKAEEAAREAARGPVLPEQLTPQDIQEALKPALAKAQECFAIYGVAGEGNFSITIDASGVVTGLAQQGYFADTPTGDCIADEVKKAVFPKTRKASTTVEYPFVLQ